MATSSAKKAALIFSLFSSIVVTWFLVFVIKFERDHHNKTLINQFISDIMCMGIVWNMVMQPITFYRYLVGPPHSYFLCGLDSVLRNGLTMHGLLLFDAIIIARFVFVYVIKNPTALQDDFWNLFTNAFITAFWIIAQTIYILAPGKNPVNYYVCTGSSSIEYLNHPVKVNHSTLYVGLFSIALHFAAAAVNLKAKDVVSQKSLFSKTTNTIGIACFICASSIIPTMLNWKEPSELDQYPNFLLLYAMHLYIPECTMLIVGFSFLWKNSLLRNRLFCDIKNFFQMIRSNETEVVVIS